MTLHKLATPYALITDIDDLILALANILNIETFCVNPTHDHIYLSNIYDEANVYLMSSAFRAPYDVWLSPEKFCELMLDIVTGMSAKEAYNKQGYAF